jgi:hypothetical protein
VNIDLISESAWTSVINGTRHVKFEFLALQLFLVTLRNRLHAKEICTLDCIRELKTFHRKFNRLPMAEKDFNKIANREDTLTNRLLDPIETARRITAGQSLMLAGEEKLLATLPPGNWVGGTIPYFMTQEGGCLCKDKIFVTEIPDEFQASIHRYAASELAGLYCDADEGAVSFVILPADSPALAVFADLGEGRAAEPGGDAAEKEDEADKGAQHEKNNIPTRVDVEVFHAASFLRAL